MNYDYLASPIRISVISYKESKTDNNTIYFTIQLQNRENKWYIQKRFSQFDMLIRNLKSYHNLPVLPNKSFLFKMNQKDLQSRKAGLQQFLRKIVIRNDLMNSQQVKQFLQLDKNASEMMVNPPHLECQYNIEGETKGVRDYFYLQEELVFIIVTADMSPKNKLQAKMTNTKMPWENQGSKFMEVGSIQYWQCGQQNQFIKRYSKGYPSEATCVSYDKVSKKIIVGLDSGIVDIIVSTSNGYEDVACLKCHQARVMGVSYDSLNNTTYTISQDKVLRVGHGSSLSLIVGVPHKEQLLSMFRDTINKRILIGTKNGQIMIYDISQAQKPKFLVSLNNNFKGAIRSLHLDISRNYLFAGTFENGDINVFDMDKPGKEKLAKMNATYKGKIKVRSIAWSARRSEVICGTADGSITFWNAIEGKAIYVLQSFDTEITRLQYLQDKQILISSSKGKTIKLWKLPQQWRDARLVAEEKKAAGKLINDHNKEKVLNAVRKAEEDSDEDDLAGWHLD